MQNSQSNNLPLQFAAQLIHDLEVPFAVTKQLLKRVAEGRHDPNNPRHRKSVESAQLAVQRGERILEDFLDRTRADASGLAIRPSQILLPDIVAQCIQILTPLFEDKKLSVRSHIENALQRPALVDGELISRVIDNLLVNAIRHAPTGSPIDVRANRNEGVIRTEISNRSETGEQIDWDRIFDPAYQVETRSQRKTRGSGLGLTFSQMVVLAHGGKIGAREERENVIFYFELPDNN